MPVFPQELHLAAQSSKRLRFVKAAAILNNFEVVVWGSPVIPPEIPANLDEDKLYHLGNQPASAIEAIIECRGVLGADFLRNFTVSLDFVRETLVLEG